MRNVPITGGREIGPPKGWDPATQGECLTISVLQSIDATGPACTTAWQFDEAELNALAAGGHFFTTDVLPFVHLRRWFVQDAEGALVGSLYGSEVGVVPVQLDRQIAEYGRAVEIAAALRAAVIALGRKLEERVSGPTLEQDWQAMDNAAAAERLADLIELVDPLQAVRRLPLLTLDDLVRGDTGKGMPFPGEPVDPTVQADLERMLGVELNPPAPPAVEVEQPGPAPEVELTSLPQMVAAAVEELGRQYAASGSEGIGYLDTDDQSAVTIDGKLDLIALVSAIRGA